MRLWLQRAWWLRRLLAECMARGGRVGCWLQVEAESAAAEEAAAGSRQDARPRRLLAVAERAAAVTTAGIEAVRGCGRRCGLLGL
eukprot:NODE_1891_length_1042_cov_272.276596.p4 GENE.NODE_1891_length_1042_cov_272.276596~~NODE_1891_length_1042_cov_272.276596.p4  ORF type:complete len:85 (+),score=7.58 NODE_1891_length_1042_cov_272.276596:312-566(+)